MLECVPEGRSEHTTGKINPAKTCQPLGAMYAALGIHGCLPHSHGSQGCCAYHRMHLTRHFRDPVLASSSSFTEGASVFGGAANLKTSIKNVFAIYNPEIMAVHTTCLSETIGDDLPNIIRQAEIPEGKTVIHVNTPSYQGSHVTGFSGMCKAMVSYLAQSDSPVKKSQMNVLPGFVNPGDMREIRRIVDAAWREDDHVPGHVGCARHPADEQIPDVPGWRGDGGRDPRFGQFGGYAGPRVLRVERCGRSAAGEMRRHRYPAQAAHRDPGDRCLHHGDQGLVRRRSPRVPHARARAGGRYADRHALPLPGKTGRTSSAIPIT